MGYDKKHRIETIYDGGLHVVILGAGASIASNMRDNELGGKVLPSMENLVEIVGLEDIIDSIDPSLHDKNFEKLYSNLHQADPTSREIRQIQKRVYRYFEDMKLPNTPTIYDHLVLSLRSKDLIATFNWDPFLFQAIQRNKIYPEERPQLAFLHGNVAIGYSEEDDRAGPSGMYTPDTKNLLKPTKLLYPVHQKDYNSDKFISMEWKALSMWLSDKSTKRVTVFGYSAPETDVEAIGLLDKAYGGRDARNMEQFEIIDIQEEDKIIPRWDEFIHSHHYNYHTDYFESSLAENPRRTCEDYFEHMTFLDENEAFSESNPIPNDISSLEDLWEWHKPLIEAEKRHKLKEK